MSAALVRTPPVFVFAKPPRPGRCKSRLAADIGAQAAAQLAAAFLRDTLSGVRAAGLDPVIATTDPDDALIASFGAPLVGQGSGGLGERLARVLGAGIDAHGAAIALGADSPGLPTTSLQALAAAVSGGRDGVIPADDGGFVALGLAAHPGALFERVPWSSPDTLIQLEARAQDAGRPLLRLDPWFDVDVADDLARLQQRVTPSAAPYSFAALGP